MNASLLLWAAERSWLEVMGFFYQLGLSTSTYFSLVIYELTNNINMWFHGFLLFADEIILINETSWWVKQNWIYGEHKIVRIRINWSRQITWTNIYMRLLSKYILE